MLKINVDFDTLFLFVPGTKTPAGVRGRGDPAGAKRRGERNAEAPCSAPTSAGGPVVEVVL